MLRARTNSGVSHKSIGAVERMNREVAGLLRTREAALEARISGKVVLDHDLISWMVRHSAWLITRFRARAFGPHCVRTRQSAQRQAGPALG